MRSVWVQATLLTIYLVLVFVFCRILDLVLWYQRGISSTQIVDPLLLSVRQLKQLLENRGVSYAGYVEKKDLAQLVEASADVVQSEVKELGHVHSGPQADKSTRERVPTPPPPARFKGGSHFYEEVEDTKDSVWLVQVVADTKPLLDEYSWRTVCSQVAPFAIRTGVLDCKLDRRLCSSKGWHYPLLLLALPKGTRAKDRVVLKTCTSTQPQTILEWVQDHLSIRVKSINDIDELNKHWLQDESAGNHTTSVSSSPSSNSKDVKVLLLTHLIKPPLFLAALSIRFTGRIKFGMFSINKEDSDAVSKKLKSLDLRIPSYVIITPERRVVYGRRPLEHFNFASMDLLLRTVHPEMNDVFLCSLFLVNMLVILHTFQISFRLWWRHVARSLWTAVSYNFWLFLVWLLILATCRFSFVRFLAEKGLVVARYLSLTEIGSLFRSDLRTLAEHPYLMMYTFIVYGFLGMWLVKLCCHDTAVTENDAEHPWWEVLPMDSYWINYLFRPMVTRTQPVPASELELEEGIEMLIERLAVPNLWLQPDTSKEYIKNLPVWKFRGWDPSVSKLDGNYINKMEDSPEVVEKIMDGEDPDETSSRGSSVHCRRCASERVKYGHELGPSNQKKYGNNCTNLHQRNVDQTHHSCCACRIEFGEVHSPCDRCRRYDGRNVHLHHSENVQTRKQSSLCVDRQTVSDLGNVKDKLSCSEESGDEVTCLPVGMRPTTRCVICLESYKCGDLLCGLPCGHNYHTRCIMVWLRKDSHDDCPVCRWPAYQSKHNLSHPHRE